MIQLVFRPRTIYVMKVFLYYGPMGLLPAKPPLKPGVLRFWEAAALVSPRNPPPFPQTDRSFLRRTPAPRTAEPRTWPRCLGHEADASVGLQPQPSRFHGPPSSALSWVSMLKPKGLCLAVPIHFDPF